MINLGNRSLEGIAAPFKQGVLAGRKCSFILWPVTEWWHSINPGADVACHCQTCKVLLFMLISSTARLVSYQGAQREQKRSQIKREQTWCQSSCIPTSHPAVAHYTCCKEHSVQPRSRLRAAAGSTKRRRKTTDEMRAHPATALRNTPERRPAAARYRWPEAHSACASCRLCRCCRRDLRRCCCARAAAGLQQRRCCCSVEKVRWLWWPGGCRALRGACGRSGTCTQGQKWNANECSMHHTAISR